MVDRGGSLEVRCLPRGIQRGDCGDVRASVGRGLPPLYVPQPHGCAGHYSRVLAAVNSSFPTVTLAICRKTGSVAFAAADRDTPQKRCSNTTFETIQRRASCPSS